MTDAVIELEIGPPGPERRRPIALRWLVFSLIGLLVLAGVAVAIGQAQRPKPPAPHTYVSSPGFSIYVGPTGDAVFIIDIHSYSGNPITVSEPKVVTEPRVTNVRIFLSRREPISGVDLESVNFPLHPGAVSIPAYSDAHLTVGYHVGCPLTGERGPFVLQATVVATAGKVRSVRNVTPVLNPTATYGLPYCPGS